MNDRRARTREADGDPMPEALNQDLGRALRGLPRERAAAGFTRRVLARLDSTNGTPVPRAERFAALRWAAAAAVAAVALAVLVVLSVDPPRQRAEAPPSVATSVPTPAPTSVEVPEIAPPEDPAPPATATPRQAAPASTEKAERLAALDAERARIARELAEIRRLAREPLPVVYVGGDETVDFVVDPQSFSRMARLDDPGLEDRTLRPTGYTIEDPERNQR